MTRENNLSRKMIPALLTIALVPLLILSLFAIYRLYKNLQENVNVQMNASMEKSEESLSLILDKYETILYDFCTDDQVVAMVETLNQEQGEREVTASVLQKQLSHICNRNTGVVGVTIFTIKGEMIYYDTLSASSASSVWISRKLDAKPQGLLTYQPNPFWVREGNGDTYLFHITRKLIDYWDIDKEIGTVVLSLDQSVLKDATVSSRRGEIYVCAAGKILCTQSKTLVGEKVESLDTENQKIARIYHEKSGWTLLGHYDLTEFERTITEQCVLWGMLAIGMGVILVYFLLYFTRPLVHSVDVVIQAMNQAEQGDFNVRISDAPDTPAEIIRISHGFNEMMEKVDLLMDQVKQALIEQKNAELSALEAQIDPHFLYNTLDTINWMAIEKEQYEISEMLGALADILRYSVKNAGVEVSILQELDWLRQYVILQSAKLGREVEMQTEIPEKIQGCRIHKLILQPFVENAFKYGFYQKQGECILKLRMEEADGQLHIMIYDNGAGISPQQVEQLNMEQTDMGEHLGVDNVRKRLKLYYSQEASVFFESKQGSYTCVHLFIPIERSED